MADLDADPLDDIPEADLLEQQTPVTIDSSDDTAVDPEPVALWAAGEQASEADLLDQARLLAGDEDYPHGATDAEEP